MKTDADSQHLLDDILAEAASDEFRSSLLARTLRHARLVRRVRVLRNTGLAAVLLAGGIWGWQALTRVPRQGVDEMANHGPGAKTAPYRLVVSHPLNPANLVETRAGTAQIVGSTTRAVGIVTTEPGSHLFKEINDDQLLLLLAGRAPVLIRAGSHGAEKLILQE